VPSLIPSPSQHAVLLPIAGLQCFLCSKLPATCLDYCNYFLMAAYWQW